MDETLKASILRDLEQKVHRWLARRLMGTDGLKRMAFNNDGLNHVDIALDDYPESIRLTIKAEWIDRKDMTT